MSMYGPLDNPEVANLLFEKDACVCWAGRPGETFDGSERLQSCTGGIFWGRPGEDWPVNDEGTPLIAWLQVVSHDFGTHWVGPYAHLQSLCLYIEPPLGLQGEYVAGHDRCGFVVREYERDAVLQPLFPPRRDDVAPSRRLSWERRRDYPHAGKYWDIMTLEMLAILRKRTDEQDLHYAGIKLGGWPTVIQSDWYHPPADHIQMPPTDDFWWGDSGIGHAYTEDGQRRLYFECY